MSDDLALERWERLSSTERQALSRRLVKSLPTGFAFQGLRRYEFGESTREVAVFTLDGSLFSLIPGGPVTLGYDAGRSWEPNGDERESWASTSEEYGLPADPREYIGKVTRRPIEVAIGPFLAETVVSELGWDSFESDGSVESLRPWGTTHADLAGRLAGSGFRFPTSDEWEYLCDAGASTLFRWGDHVPADRYPTDASPSKRLPTPWNFHERLNAFGAIIAENPYHSELVAEPEITRGGDGGGSICGGAGFFIGWLTLATAYFEDHSCRRDPANPIDEGFTMGHRVLPLA